MVRNGPIEAIATFDRRLRVHHYKALQVERFDRDSTYFSLEVPRD